MTASEVEKYMAMVTSVKEQERRRTYYVGEKFFVDVFSIQHDLSDRHDMMNVWKRAGYISKVLATSLSVSTEYKDWSGLCTGDYNITLKRRDDGHAGYVIDFDYLREATPENERELVAECIRLACMDGAFDEYEVTYDWCDSEGNESRNIRETFKGNWTDLQDYIKGLRESGCYHIDAACIRRPMEEDVV